MSWMTTEIKFAVVIMIMQALAFLGGAYAVMIGLLASKRGWNTENKKKLFEGVICILGGLLLLAGFIRMFFVLK